MTSKEPKNKSLAQTRINRQPDFQKLFNDHFGSTPRKVAYEVRNDANRYHDLAFLNTLIHDARFRREAIRTLGKEIVIPLDRDCWELPLVRHPKHWELHVTDAELSIAPVISIVWKFRNTTRRRPSTELWIQDLQLVGETSLKMRLIIRGQGWRCEIVLDDYDSRIALRDLKTPYLHSQRKR